MLPALPPPTANNSTLPAQPNNGYTIPIPAAQFTGSDADGSIQSIRITTFPTNAVSITIGNVVYTQAEFNAAFPLGATIPTNASGNPLQSIGVKPAPGVMSSIVIPYITIDNTGLESSPASVTVPFSTILAATGLSFTVTNGRACTQILNWQTLTELNTRSFVPMYSTNGTTWLALATIRAAGTSSFANAYSFLNSAPAKGSNYYRIEVVDKDGTRTYSNTVQVTSNCNGKGLITVYPNPVKDILHVLASGVNANKALTRLTDATGRIMATTVTVAGNTVNVNTAGLPAGVYTLQVQYDSLRVYSQKIIKL